MDAGSPFVLGKAGQEGFSPGDDVRTVGVGDGGPGTAVVEGCNLDEFAREAFGGQFLRFRKQVSVVILVACPGRHLRLDA